MLTAQKPPVPAWGSQLMRRLNEEGYSKAHIAYTIGYSVETVKTLLRYYMSARRRAVHRVAAARDAIVHRLKLRGDRVRVKPPPTARVLAQMACYRYAATSCAPTSTLLISWHPAAGSRATSTA